MRLDYWMILGLLLVLLSGCGTITVECDWTRTIPIGGQQSIDWLLMNDRQLLADVTAHNEVRDRLCQ